jgi:hypothetical protein
VNRTFSDFAASARIRRKAHAGVMGKPTICGRGGLSLFMRLSI